MSFVNTIWIMLQWLIGYHLILPVVLLAIFLIRKVFGTSNVRSFAVTRPDYGVIVTAYEQTSQLPAVVASLLGLDYDAYHIYVVADKCDISGLDFPAGRVSVLRPETVLGSNTRSHFYAIRRFIRPHSHLTIIDSDNLVEPDYLSQLNPYFDQGYEAVQGVRAAKNLESTYACLDAARDIYYHFYDGKILFGAGSSATLAGSGMAFTTSLYRTCLEHLDVTGAGFDKVLQEGIVRRGYRIAFAEKAIVYDEKTTGSDQLVKQRARWINTWFKYFGYGFGMMFRGIGTFNWNQLIFGLVLLRPPLFIFLLLSVVFLVVNLFFAPLVSLLWLGGLVVFVSGFFIALGASHTDHRIYRSLAGIPRFISLQVLALLKARKANQISVATRHGSDQTK